jgi:hypothetical protein
MRIGGIQFGAVYIREWFGRRYAIESGFAEPFERLCRIFAVNSSRFFTILHNPTQYTQLIWLLFLGHLFAAMFFLPEKDQSP